MLRFTVGLKCPTGSRSLVVQAADEWLARQVAIRRNVREGGPVMWVDSISAGIPA